MHHFRYRSGIRGYMKSVVLDLLRRYLQVEMQFQQGKSPSVILMLLSQQSKQKMISEVLSFFLKDINLKIV